MTPALDEYPLHLDNDITQYMHMALYCQWHTCFHPLPFTSVWPSDSVQLLLSWAGHSTSLAQCHKTNHHTCVSWAQPGSLVLIISETMDEMRWKMGQWRFLVETRCHLETIEVPLTRNLYLRHDSVFWKCILLSWPLCSYLMAILIFWKGSQDHY